MAPFNASCTDDEEKLFWFRNFKSPKAFGPMNKNQCQPATLNPPPRTLDFSLQMQVAIQNVLDKNDKNPCAPAPVPVMASRKALPAKPYEDAPRIERR
jgi:hypothetical protein